VTSPVPIDTRALFRPVSSSLVTLLRGLPLDRWDSPTVAGAWVVRDVVGREFTELWHHQQQIRMAVGAEALADPRFLSAVIDVAMRGLPHAFRDVTAEPGQTVVIDISGASGSRWTLSREERHWTLLRGEPSSATTRVRLNDDTAWKILFNAMSESDAVRAVRIDGPKELRRAFLRPDRSSCNRPLKKSQPKMHSQRQDGVA
jgi:hypothetical protein